MSSTPVPRITLTPVCRFPEKYFLENLTVRADGSVLVTTVLQKELWYVRPESGAEPEPVLVHTFDHLIMGIVEAEPDVFVVCVTDGYDTHLSYLARIDLNGWTPGEPVSPEIIYTFDHRARSLNGAELLRPGVMVVADCFAGHIWRVDLAEGARSATASIWLAHDTMKFDPDSGVAPPPQPGVNGVRFGPRTGYLYYTSTAQKVFMRVPVDRSTLDPSGPPEFVAAISDGDDFCVDETAGFAYVTRHRANTFDRVPLTPGHGSEVRHLVGDPFDERLVGPSSAAWGRGTGDYGRIAYITTDGGRTAPPEDGIIRRAAVLRAELQPAKAAESAAQ